MGRRRRRVGRKKKDRADDGSGDEDNGAPRRSAGIGAKALAAITSQVTEQLEGGAIEERPDDAIFFVDNESEATKKKNAVRMTRAERKAANRAKVLKMDEILAPNPHSKILGIKTFLESQRKQTSKRTRKIAQEGSIHERRRAEAYAASLVKEAAETGADVAEVRRKRRPSRRKEAVDAGTFDVWDQRLGDDPAHAVAVLVHASDHPTEISRATVDPRLLDRDVAEYVLPTLRKHKRPAPTRRRRAPIAAAPKMKIEPAGNSYNPTYDDHQDVLGEAVAKIIKEQDEERLVREQLRGGTKAIITTKFTVANPSELVADEHRLAGEVGGNDGKGGGGAVSDDDDDDDGKDDDNDGDNSGNDDDDEVPFQRYDADGNERYSVGPPVVVVRRTRAQWNKLKKRKALDAEIASRRAAKRQKNDLQNWRGIQRSIEAKAEKRRKKKEYLATLKDEDAIVVPQIGTNRFQEAEQDLLLPEELPKSLRQLRPQGSIAFDRYKAYQRRGVITIMKPQVKRRRYALKEYETHGAKNWARVNAFYYEDPREVAKAAKAERRRAKNRRRRARKRATDDE